MNVDDWWEFAACARVDPELWFPHAGDAATAKSAALICAQCPVVAECLADESTTEEQIGMRAGLTSRRRRKMRKVAKAS